jgi:hypothetical protein
MDDEGLAPVVAVMLILAIVVTLLSVWNATFLPSLKEQAEIEHISEVEQSFLAFGSDLEAAASLKQAVSLKRRIPLGGGDILLNTLKSSGTLWVREEKDWLYNLTFGTSPPVTARMVNISYHPINNFWQNQGYRWRYGYVNVTKNGWETPLEVTTMARLRCDFANDTGGLPFTLVDIEGRGSAQMVLTTCGNTTQIESNAYNCTDIIVSVVNITPGDSDFVSGSGVGTLALTTTVVSSPATSSDYLMVTANPSLPLPYDAKITGHFHDQCEALNRTFDNIAGVTQPAAHAVRLDLDEPVNVTVRMVSIEVEAY